MQRNRRPSKSLRASNRRHAKRAKLKDTKLQDLPIELLECILVEAVVMEVKGLKLAKSVWSDKVEPVISRLSRVCSHWSSVLSSISFQTKLHRALDATEPSSIHLEVLHEYAMEPVRVRALTTVRDELYTLICYSVNNKDYSISVYHRNDLTMVTDVIPLPRADPGEMAGCSMSSCLYLILRNGDGSSSLCRISRNVDQQFIKSLWLSHMQSILMISVSPNGNLVIFSSESEWNSGVVSKFDAKGTLQHEIKLSINHVKRYDALIQKSNENVILAFVNDRNDQKTLLEFDRSGCVVSKYESSCSEECSVNVADIYGRILVNTTSHGMELLDYDLNFLGLFTLQQDVGKNLFQIECHYDSVKNEIWRCHYDNIRKVNVLTTFRVI